MHFIGEGEGETKEVGLSQTDAKAVWKNRKPIAATSVCLRSDELSTSLIRRKVGRDLGGCGAVLGAGAWDVACRCGMERFRGAGLVGGDGLSWAGRRGLRGSGRGPVDAGRLGWMGPVGAVLLGWIGSVGFGAL